MKRKGFTFISVLVAFFILATGILYLVKVYPVIDKLSGRNKRYIIASQIAENLFTLLEEVYGNSDGPSVPSFISGVDEKFPLYSYYVSIDEEKEGLYRVEIEITGKEEGRNEREYFSGSFRRK
ncbi:MAG TPA: prepilin-type N-terminal cleavage/methylation domain-containing protein [bacterium]|nr:prepilin-type N-terminal cleavage/methylation domain-containing protein [bacterium]HPP30532.1 prepilin-type N-terminal cleavage/methylation domain-containing protein [bacterium]